MKIVSTIEARMTSSRLPGKVLLEADGKPMLEHLIDRLRQVKEIGNIVIATTTNRTDDVLERFAEARSIPCFRGSEDDVMGRVAGAAKSVGADIVVEITGDCPLIDPDIVGHAIRMFLRNPCDYLSTEGYPDGMDTQVFHRKTLEKSLAMTAHPLDREHVTRHIRMNPEIFSQLYLVAPPNLHWPELGLTLDEPKDYELLRRIIEHFGPKHRFFSCGETLQLLKESHPEWLSINQDVKRKGMN